MQDRTVPTVGVKWQRDPIGHVYFIQAGSRGPVKIGWATDVDKRMAALQTGCPESLILRRQIATNDRRLESKLHRRFKQLLLGGEWFKVDAELEAYMCSTDDPPLLPLNRQSTRKGTGRKWAKVVGIDTHPRWNVPEMSRTSEADPRSEGPNAA